jgi:hypothetical protein
MWGRPFIRVTKTDVGIDMSNFAPLLVPSPYDFQIENDGLGNWIVRERDDRAGGVFFSRKEAIRYALFEAGSDPSRVHAEFAAPAPRSNEMSSAAQCGSASALRGRSIAKLASAASIAAALQFCRDHALKTLGTALLLFLGLMITAGRALTLQAVVT